ncbi:hypothetical protein F5Y04DRAFT_252396 [Hypomontagnella monticulosa]|nr:hypothetical protein F5Y04DRAFT_252396 [Hypomontagnella monticulosa]
MNPPIFVDIPFKSSTYKISVINFADMATSDATQELLSFEALRNSQIVRLTPDAKRIFWSLNGPLSTSVWVLEDASDPDSAREAYFRQTIGGTTWHPVSQSQLTQPGVSSITVRVSDLENREDNWFDVHDSHADPNDENCVFGELIDFDPDEDEDGPEHVLKCCGSERPRKKAAYLVVKATSECITIHDYVSAVHPWLMGLREDILGALGVWDSKPRPPETKLMVNFDGPGYLMIQEEKSWLAARRRTRDILLARPEGGNFLALGSSGLGDFTLGP